MTTFEPTLRTRPDFLNRIDTAPCVQYAMIFELAAEHEVWAVKQAKVVCNSCVYKRRCRDYGLSQFEHWGIWGGLTYEDRRRALRRQKRTSRKTL